MRTCQNATGVLNVFLLNDELGSRLFAIKKYLTVSQIYFAKALFVFGPTDSGSVNTGSFGGGGARFPNLGFSPAFFEAGEVMLTTKPGVRRKNNLVNCGEFDVEVIRQKSAFLNLYSLSIEHMFQLAREAKN